MLETLFAPWVDIGPLILRIGLAVIFFAYGWPKIRDVEKVAGSFKGMNIPMPKLMAWVVALLETVGSLLLVLGLATRLLAVAFAFNMLVATFKAKIGLMKVGFKGPSGWALDFSLMVSALSLFFTGAGAFALDAAFGF